MDDKINLLSRYDPNTADVLRQAISQNFQTAPHSPIVNFYCDHKIPDSNLCPSRIDDFTTTVLHGAFMEKPDKQRATAPKGIPFIYNSEMPEPCRTREYFEFKKRTFDYNQ